MAKKAATVEPKAPKPKVIKRLKEEDVREWFRTPDRFLKFLKRLPPGKMIEHPVMHTEAEEASVPTAYAAFWLVMSWFFRDAQGLPKDQGPDTVIGVIATHYYGPEPPTKEQTMLLYEESGWMARLWSRFGRTQAYRRRLQVAEVARATQDIVDGVEDIHP